MTRRRASLLGLVLGLLAIPVSLAPAADGDDTLDDLLTAFQMTLLGDQKPTPFTLESINGKSISLADVRGRAVLLYFWDSG